MDAFAWIGQIVEALGRLIPRLVIVRATHQGVKWVCGSRVKAMLPGLHVYWPITTEFEVLVCARQTLNLSTQVLMTQDRQQVVVGMLVVYRVKDVVEAIGKRNWDVETTIKDITQAAIVEVITTTSLSDLLAGLSTTIEKRLTGSCRKQLRQFGVYIHRAAMTDFSQCKTFKLLGDEQATKHLGH